MSQKITERYELKVSLSKLRPWAVIGAVGSLMHFIALVIFLGPHGGFTGGAIRVVAAIFQILALVMMISGIVNVLQLKKKKRLTHPTEMERNISFGLAAAGGLLAVITAVLQLIFLTSSGMVLLMLFGGALVLDGALYIYTVYAKN